MPYKDVAMRRLVNARYRDKNRELLKAKGLLYWSSMPEEERQIRRKSQRVKHAVSRREYDSQWQRANPEKVSAKKVRYFSKPENLEKARAYCRRYKKNNPLVVRALNHKRRASIKGNGGVFTVAEWLQLVKRFDNTCLRCRRLDLPLTPDHVIPLSKGGDNYISNIQPLCLKCNQSKGSKATDYRALFPPTP
jgi:5-methylcytosine-specific restriction endonuclease McrA